jgi:lysophospholipase L1-like esterase
MSARDAIVGASAVRMPDQARPHRATNTRDAARDLGSGYRFAVTRLICLGDSFTEGMSDDLRPDGRHMGWSDRLAAGLAADRSGVAHCPVTYANLAIRGKLLHQVVDEQFGPALTLGADIITFHAGANDVLRPATDLPDLYARYDAAVEQLTSTGARVVLFTSLARAGGSGRFADRLERAFQAFNHCVREVAARHGATLVDLEAVHALTDRRFWAADRLHLNDLGHARVAAAILAELGITDPQVLGGPIGWWAESLPPAPPRSRRDDLAGDVEWVRVHLMPWIGRRVRRVSSGDGLAPKERHPRAIASDQTDSTNA